MVLKNMKQFVFLFQRIRSGSMMNRLFAFQRALEDLKKKLLHQWDFVTMQAEAQFR